MVVCLFPGQRESSVVVRVVVRFHESLIGHLGNFSGVRVFHWCIFVSSVNQ